MSKCGARTFLSTDGTTTHVERCVSRTEEGELDGDGLEPRAAVVLLRGGRVPLRRPEGIKASQRHGALCSQTEPAAEHQQHHPSGQAPHLFGRRRKQERGDGAG